MTKVIIADDHELVVEGLKMLLHGDNIEVIATASNGDAVIDLIQREIEIDVLILDINMPGKDGIEVTKEIKFQYPEVKILILTMYRKVEFIKNLIKIGADGYVLKNSGKGNFIKAIEALVKGEKYFSEDVMNTVMNSYAQTWETNDFEPITLSDREKEVAVLIAKEKSTLEIAETLHLSHHTINSHRKSLLSKLDVKNAAGVFRYALKTGLIKEFDA